MSILAFGATAAHACDCTISSNWGKPQCKGKTPKGIPTAVLQSAASAAANATSVAAQGQLQTQSQVATTGASTSTSAAQGGSAVSAAKGGNATGGAGGAAQGGSASASDNGNSAATAGSSGNATTYNEAQARIPVNAAVAGFQVTTASCRFAEGVGIQTMPAGTSVGLTFKDHDCVRAELAQMLYSRGQNVAGDRIMCEIREIRDALGSDCLAIIGTRTEAPAADAVTHEELQTVERRMLQRGVSK